MGGGEAWAVARSGPLEPAAAERYEKKGARQRFWHVADLRCDAGPKAINVAQRNDGSRTVMTCQKTRCERCGVGGGGGGIVHVHEKKATDGNECDFEDPHCGRVPERPV